ncbi:MAG: winged helix-turn-helix domain-containing protein [Acidobacteria bacterium]|nr:winged helix-turn-helix domain-containing protein [Acidobacteriota bacterium]
MIFRFDEHSFDPDTGELSGPSGSHRLQPKPAQLLAMLLGAGGNLVERDAIRAELWPRTNVDFDSGLNTCTRQIRAAFAESGGNPEWVETLPKRGHRFTVAVEEGSDTPTRPTAVEMRALDGGGGATGSAGLSSTQYVGLAVVIVAMIAAAVLGWVLAGLPADGALNRARLAILPFNDPDSEQIADFNRALAAAFVVALTNADPENIAVVGPATTGQMLLAGLTPGEIGERTNADFILLGGHRESDHLTFVEVLVAPGLEHLFAQRFELDESRPAHAPPEVVAAITEAINGAGEAPGEGQN